MTDLFTPLNREPLAPGTLERLHRRLADAAHDEDLLDVGYRVLDSPVGPLLVAATSVGLVRVAFDADRRSDEVLQELATDVSPRVLAAPRRLDRAAAELEEYFAGRRHRFDLDLDTRLAHGFRLEVIRALPGIGFGRTASYAEVAAMTGRERAVRAVGTACARNPLPLVLPCHRVVRSDGTLGQYAGGAERKQQLLDLERG